ncbi:hypothetical protein MMC22_007200 [Lobaria immixta]|nr:hypothetical protein [Lobaria immixta]
MSYIDVHQHVYPDAFYEALENAGGDPIGWPTPAWSLESTKEFLKAADIRTAILSVTTPGPPIETDSGAAALLAQNCNEFSAKLRSDDPSTFGFFASLPSLLDKEVTLKELERAFDVLGADGVTLYTRYGSDNHYLGHPDFAWLWEELNRRKAVVFVHPTQPVDTTLVNPDLPPPVFDLPHETGRAAIDLITSGRLRSSPQCKIILSHAGGTFPGLIYRAAGMLPYVPKNPVGMTTEEIIHEAKEFYFDTSLASNPVSLKALFEFAKPRHVVFGTDFPAGFEQSIEYFTNQWESFEIDPEQRKDVNSAAALDLFPRLRSTNGK